MASIFRGVIEFFDKLGLFDVLIPFLIIMIFSLWFLIKKYIKDQKFWIKLLLVFLFWNISWFIAFLFIAITNLIGVINELMANLVLLLIMIGVFYFSIHQNEKISQKTKNITLGIVVFIILLLVMHGVQYKGEPLLSLLFG